MHFVIKPSGVLLSVIPMCLVLLFTPSSVATAPQPETGEPHDFQAYGLHCRDCHKVVGLKESGEMIKPITVICQDCHTVDGMLSHPMNIKPSFRIPTDLPLDTDGMMTCATCHDPHKSYRNSLTGKRTMYLRREGHPKELCNACHQKT
jgi:hypothetical protein